jgi:hypothetical protein
MPEVAVFELRLHQVPLTVRGQGPYQLATDIQVARKSRWGLKVEKGFVHVLCSSCQGANYEGVRNRHCRPD